uniref:Uncharacterized protein n=1 Tax=Timema poppense TaxID=170557 RepID=A0A7R9D4A6_TIMPO|nr:unnamed protein product [Timema poppensis]
MRFHACLDCNSCATERSKGSSTRLTIFFGTIPGGVRRRGRADVFPSDTLFTPIPYMKEVTDIPALTRCKRPEIKGYKVIEQNYLICCGPPLDSGIQLRPSGIFNLETTLTEMSQYNSPMTSLVLTDSSQPTADGFEKLPDQIMYPYAEPYDLQKHALQPGRPIRCKGEQEIHSAQTHTPASLPVQRALCRKKVVNRRRYPSCTAKSKETTFK